ncbi:hypothetical protein [uncultured Mucilaginibacter sp.]|uniref:hypothetical protein n=1 Tax=uncultured Mucilaginibacter sp. TaxID=797541 RepID=UPI0025F4A5D5|nr:hypothetical protein [uncultured Mucilaginibacter sp.]
MTTLTINIPDNAKVKLSAIVKELGGEIVQIKKRKAKTAREKEAALLKQIEAGLKDVADIRAGKIKGMSLSEALHG